MARDIWYIKNVSAKQITLGDLPKLPTIDPNKTFNLLQFHSKEEILQSKNLLTVLNNSWVTIKKIEDGQNTDVSGGTSASKMAVAYRNEITGSGGGGGGNPFDQSLNTTDNVQFNQLNLANTGLLSIYQSNDQPQMAFNIGESGFSFGFDTNRAIVALSMFGTNLYMNNAQGSNGGSLYMDGGLVLFPTLNNDYSTPAFLGRGQTDAGFGGGISLYCNATYELNWQNGVLTVNGTGPNQSGTISNVAIISGPITGSAIQATATLSGSGTPNDGDLIVINYGFSQPALVFIYRTNPSQPLEFTFDNTSEFYFVTVVNTASMGGQVEYNGTDYVFTNTQGGASGNQDNGCTLTGYTLTNFTGGSDGAKTVTINSDVVINGTLAYTLPYITLTEANDGINLDGTYDIYFLYVGVDNVQFTVNLPDPSGLAGRELTFINSGQQSEFYPSIAGNIQNSPGNQFNLSNECVKMISDGKTWWISTQV